MTGTRIRWDWWRFWIASAPASAVTTKSVSVTVRVNGREHTIGYRRKGWIA